MARFTVEDCMKNIDNRFDMTIAAALRARQIENGSEIMVDHTDNHKPTVIALLEIAANKVDRHILSRIE